MKKNKIKTIDDTAKALKKCGRKKKALIVIATLTGTYIAYYIVKQVKKRKARELSERLRFGKYRSGDANKDMSSSEKTAEFLAGYSDGYEDGYDFGFEKGSSINFERVFQNGYEAGYKSGFDKGFRSGEDKVEDEYAEFADRAMEKYDFDEEDVANEDNK